MSQLHTTYEIAATNEGGRRLLVVYANRKTTRRLLEIIRERYDSISVATDTFINRVEDIKGGSYPACRYGSWSIAYTGRTRLQAKSEGELESVAEVASDPDAIVIPANPETLSVA
jgi:hypothetical protein